MMGSTCWTFELFQCMQVDYLTVSSLILSLLTKRWSGIWCGSEWINTSNSLSLRTDVFPDQNSSSSLSSLEENFWISLILWDVVTVLSILKCLANVWNSSCRFNAMLNLYNRQTRIIFDVVGIVTLISNL